MTLPKLIRFDRVDSTMAEARRYLEANGVPSEEILIQADEQKLGEGRRNRQWLSPPGNLYTTLITNENSPLIVYVAAVALHRSITTCLPDLKVQCKWPNDIIIDNKKIGGVLAEVDPRTKALMVGVGLNVAVFPKETGGLPATSLHRYNTKITVDEILSAYINQLDHWRRVWNQNGFAAIREEWTQVAYKLGENITLKIASGEIISGILKGLDLSGALVVEVSGREICYNVGDIVGEVR